MIGKSERMSAHAAESSDRRRVELPSAKIAAVRAKVARRCTFVRTAAILLAL